MGFFASADAIADAKAEILEQARPTDVLVANADDARIAARIGGFGGRVVTFGIDAAADVRATSVAVRGLEGTAARVQTPAGAFELETPLLGLGNLSNVLAATAVALQFDVPLDAIAATAAALRPAHRRGELLRLPGGVTLIDDSYNSSPSALRRALETMSRRPPAARARSRSLGEMLELGDARDARCTRRAARRRPRAGLDLLVTVGGAPAQALADAAIGGRHARPQRSCTSPSSAEAADVALAARASRRSRAGEGIARHRHGCGRRSAEGGVRLMLYHLLYPLHTHFAGLQRDPLHHVPHRGGQSECARHRPVRRAVDDSQASRVSDRPGHSPGRSRDAPRQGRARRPWAGC